MGEIVYGDEDDDGAGVIWGEGDRSGAGVPVASCDGDANEASDPEGCADDEADGEGGE